jgi:predicted short-subunit dehydrogenase-like oxidoreductase (DUF2520 family)
MSQSQTQGGAAPPDETIAIVGAGRVGISLGVLLQRAGRKILAAAARTEPSRERATDWLGCPVFDDPVLAAKEAGTVLVAVPDDALEDVALRLADADAARPGAFVVHTAGSIGVTPLGSLSEKGARTLAVHPLQAIPDIETGIARIPGSWFGVTCDEDLRPWAEALVEDLGGRPLLVYEADRPAYHLAATMASNFLVTLARLVEKTADDVKPYLPLMEGTLANIRDLGVEAALTGPIARGDAGTIARHLETLREKKPEVEGFYRAISVATLLSALDAGRLSDEQARDLLKLLQGSEHLP